MSRTAKESAINIDSGQVDLRRPGQRTGIGWGAGPGLYMSGTYPSLWARLWYADRNRLHRPSLQLGQVP